MKAALLALILGVALLAGCAQTENGTPPVHDTPVPPQRYQVPFDQMPEDAGHVHGDPTAHKFLWNYEFTARDPILSNPANAAGLHAMDLQNGYLFGAMYGSHGASVDGGVQVWDVTTDPAHPKALGRWTIPGSVGGDRSIGATEDGEYVVIGTEPVDCLGHVNPFAAVNAYLIDVRNKDAPVVSDVITPSGGSAGGPTTVNPRISTHSVWVQRIAGTDYAFIFGDIYRIDRPEGAPATLAYVSTVNTGHDLYVRNTPFNTTWALSADGDPGDFVAYDVTDPTNAFEIARMKSGSLSNSEGTAHYLHTADVAFVGNQTLIILASEDFNGDWPSPFWVLDGTGMESVKSEADAIDLRELGEWHNPYNHTAENIRFSLHNQRVHDGGLMTISSYHAGFFQFDLRHPEFWSKPSLIAAGAYAEGSAPLTVDPIESTIENTLCNLGITVDAPMYMDVAVGGNGTLYFADVFMGLYTFAPTADHPVYGTPMAASENDDP